MKFIKNIQAKVKDTRKQIEFFRESQAEKKKNAYKAEYEKAKSYISQEREKTKQQKTIVRANDLRRKNNPIRKAFMDVAKDTQKVRKNNSPMVKSSFDRGKLKL